MKYWIIHTTQTITKDLFPKNVPQPYLEKLSTIYQNINQIPFIDSPFNEFNFHANPTYNFPTPFKTMYLEVSKNVDWFETFEATGTSGITTLDRLMVTFAFNKSLFISFPNSKIYVLESEKDFINITGLLSQFAAVEGVLNADVPIQVEGEDDYYKGEPYFISGNHGISGWAELCDIFYIDDMFIFSS